MKLSLENKVIAGFLIALTLLLLIGVVSHRSITGLAGAAARTEHAQQVLTRLASLLATMTDIESGQRGYVITGDERFLEPYNAAIGRAGSEFTALQQLIIDPAQQERLRRLSPVLTARIENAREVVRLRRTDGFEAAQRVIAAGTGRETQERIRVMIAEMTVAEEQLLQERENRARASARFARAVIWVGSGLSVALVSLAVLLLRRDFRARHAAEEELRLRNDLLRVSEERQRQLSEQLRKIFDFSLDVICSFDAEGRFVQVSRACEAVWGYRPEELLGTAYIEKVLPDDRPKTNHAAAEIVAGRSTVGFENRYVRKDGSVAHIHWSAQWSDAEQIMYCVARDITDRKKIEEVEHALRHTLQQTVDDLLRKNREIENFYHTLSHELKTPLTSAREFVSILLDGLAGPLTPTQAEYLAIAKDSCDQLCVSINDLLDSSRLETGKMALELKEGSLTETLERVVASLKPVASKRELQLTFEAAPDLPSAIFDEHRIAQVLTNLLNNAFKFTPAGGAVCVRVTERADSLLVAVADTGRGIPAEHQARIFERLHQVKESDASTEQGMGLGLYLCHQLIVLHGGRIWVESEQGRGSTFFFTVRKR